MVYHRQVLGHLPPQRRMANYGSRLYKGPAPEGLTKGLELFTIYSPPRKITVRHCRTGNGRDVELYFCHGIPLSPEWYDSDKCVNLPNNLIILILINPCAIAQRWISHGPIDDLSTCIQVMACFRYMAPLGHNELTQQGHDAYMFQ